jgi:predicted enzyme related to lactoylglutathione lyase
MAFPALIVFPVSDMTSAVAFYTSVLGGGPYFESPYYAGFKTETGEIGLDPNARNGGPLPYWDVEDLDATIASLTEAGATVVKEPSDVGGGMTIAVLADPVGTAIGFRQAAS